MATTPTGTDPVLLDVSEAVATITLNRPERLNAWTPPMGALFSDLMERAGRDPAVRVIVVTGAGRGFCAGADMEVLQSVGGGSAVVGSERRVLPTEALSVPKPVIAAINGACAGLGLVIAACCDIRFAAAGAKFTSSFARRGLIAEYGISWLLPRLVGQGAALDILYSGRVFRAEEALQMGLVNRVADPAALLDETHAYARELAENCSPASLAAIKAQVYRHLDTSLEEAVADSLTLMETSLRGDDFREGVASFLEQRAPRFKAPGPAG